MKIIAHRGNLNGPDPATENTIEQSEKCFALGFDVEVDVWHTSKGFYMGHDKPLHYVSHGWLINNKDKLFIHAKGTKALSTLIANEDMHCFAHKSDDVALTSFNWLWHYPGVKIFKPDGWVIGVVACLPELAPDWDTSQATHICTDYPIMYREKYMRTVSQ